MGGGEGRGGAALHLVPSYFLKQHCHLSIFGLLLSSPLSIASPNHLRPWLFFSTLACLFDPVEAT